MGLLLAGCQRSLDKIVIKCNQKKTEAIFHRIKITGKLEIVDGKGDGMTKGCTVTTCLCVGMCERVPAEETGTMKRGIGDRGTDLCVSWMYMLLRTGELLLTK